MNMNEKEFRAWYKAKQHTISASDALKHKVLAQAAQQSTEAETSCSQQATYESERPSVGDSCQPKVFVPSTRRDLFRPKRRWAVPAAACAAALAVAICAPLAVSNVQSTFCMPGQDQGVSVHPSSLDGTDVAEGAPQAGHSLFNVCAYASSLDSFIPAEDGLVRFSLDMNLDRQLGQTNDWYPGAVFVLDGEGIERIQATLSNGELCRYTFEDLIRSEDQEKITELLGWKPTSRGFGEYYSSFDYVEVIAGSPDLDKLDPNYEFKTRLIKRYGSTVDIEINPDEPFILGMWFDAGNFPLTSDGAVDLAALEGETLTVTAQFADGSSQTQVIKLHKGTFKQESLDYLSDTAEDAVPTGAPLSEVEGQYVDEAGNVVEEEATVTTLYGEIISTTNEPHPYSLENANDHANAVVAVDQSAFEDWLKRDLCLGLTGLPGEGQLVEGAVLPSTLLSSTSDELEFIPVEVSEVSVELSQDLPEEINFENDTELASYLGNFEYMNYILQARDGFTVDEAGRLCDGFSYAVVRATITNGTDTQASYSRYTPALTLGMQDEASNGLLVARELFGSTFLTDSLAEDPDSVVLEPGQSCQVVYAFVLPNEVTSNEDYIVLGVEGVSEDITETSQLADVKFLKL